MPHGQSKDGRLISKEYQHAKFAVSIPLSLSLLFLVKNQSSVYCLVEVSIQSSSKHFLDLSRVLVKIFENEVSIVISFFL